MKINSNEKSTSLPSVKEHLPLALIAGILITILSLGFAPVCSACSTSDCNSDDAKDSEIGVKDDGIKTRGISRGTESARQNSVHDVDPKPESNVIRMREQDNNLPPESVSDKASKE